MTYNPSLAKVNVDPHIKYRGHGSAVRAFTDGRTLQILLSPCSAKSTRSINIAPNLHHRHKNPLVLGSDLLTTLLNTNQISLKIVHTLVQYFAPTVLTPRVV